MKKVTKNHERKKSKVKNLIAQELSFHDFKAEGFKYLISLIIVTQKENEFIPIGYEIAKKIQDAIKHQMAADIVYDADELSRLTELIVAPLEQRAVFDFSAQANNTAHPQCFFCNRLWKNLLNKDKFDKDYIERLQVILKAGLGINVKVRYDWFELKKDVVKNYTYCPYFITTFVLSWLVFKTEAKSNDFVSYNKVIQTFNAEKQIVFIFYYILFKVVSDIDKYEDDNGNVKDFREERIYDILQKYVLDTDLTNIEKDERIIIPKSFSSTVDSIIKEIGKQSVACAELFDLIDVADIESITDIDSNKRWNDKSAMVNNIIARS